MMALKSDVSMNMLLGVSLGYATLHARMNFGEIPSLATLLMSFQTMVIPLLPTLGMMALLGMIAILALKADVQDAIKEEKQAVTATTHKTSKQAESEANRCVEKARSDMLCAPLVGLVAIAIPMIFTPANLQAMFKQSYGSALLLSLQVTILPLLPIVGAVIVLGIPCALAMRADVLDCMKEETQQASEPAVVPSK